MYLWQRRGWPTPAGTTSAIDGNGATPGRVLRTAGYWQRHGDEALGARQKAMLNRLLDGFDGRLTTKKWALLTKVSVATAQRDVDDLIARGLLAVDPGGAGTPATTRPTREPQPAHPLGR